jgi:hypothetical protein
MYDVKHNTHSRKTVDAILEGIVDEALDVHERNAQRLI